MEFIFNGRGKADRTQHERIAMKNIKGAINYIVGGYYNSLQDGYIEDLPKSLEQLEAIIYNEAMNNVFGDGYCGSNKAPKEMRFAGTEFCMAYITWKLDQDGDVQEISEAAGWNKQTEQPSEKKEEKPIFNFEKPEKLQKILDYVPWCKADAIYSCWKDSDGYWIQLNEGWNADRMDYNCRTIHEDTIYDLRYQIGGIRKVN